MNPLQQLLSQISTPQALDLVWVMGDVDDCLFCGHDLHRLYAPIRMPEVYQQPVAFELYQCAHCRCRYGWLDELMAFLVEAEIDLQQLGTFQQHKTRLRTGVLVEGQGMLPWEEFSTMLDAARKQAEADQQPVHPAEVQVLGVEQEAWEMNQRVLQWVSMGEEEPVMAFIALVTDAQGSIRHHQVFMAAPPTPDALANLVFRAAVTPSAVTGHAARPLALHIPPALNTPELRRQLDAVGISLGVAAIPNADKALEEIAQTMTSHQGTPYLRQYDPLLLRAFFKTAQTFFRTKPWQYFDGNKFVAFRLNEQPWGYLNIMGQAGEHPGLSYHPDWISICRIVHRPPLLPDTLFFLMEAEEDDMSAEIAQTGTLESVGLVAPYELHPEDALYLRELGIKPMRGGAYPLPLRLSEDGPEAPLLPLTTYMLLMETLVDLVQNRRGARITSIKKTFTGPHHTLTLHYPSKGDEDWAGTGAFCLRVAGHNTRDASFNPLPEGHQLEIIAPGDAGFYEISRALAQQTQLHLLEVGQEQTGFWFNRSSRGAPSPRLYQLQPRPNLWASFGLDRYALSLTPLPEHPAGGISVTMIRP